MPKSVEHEDGSEPDSYPLKIRISPLWRDLALSVSVVAPVNFSMASMKRSLRPFFSVLLFVFVMTSFVCRVAIRRSSAIAELRTSGLFPQPEPFFNSTLLEFSAVDPGETKFRQEIDQLVDYEDTSVKNYNRRSNSNHHGSRRYSSRLPVMLRSPQFHRYWSDFRRNLHIWTRKKTFEPNIMFDLVRLVKHQIDTHNGLPTSNKKYSSCAVVGNSGIVLNSQYGNLIDSHEAVIRLNNARTERFEKYVGSKTTISFINSNILHLCARRKGCYCHPYGETVPTVMYICQPVHFLDFSVCRPSHKSPLIVTDPRFDVLCARIVKYYSVKRFVEQTGKSFAEWSNAHEGSLFHYSSGLQAVMLALGVCDRVSVFGFGKAEKAKHHYHTNQKSELSLHDYASEYDFYHDLMKNKRAIPFFPDKFKFPPVVIHH